jgi:SAM-dependent methyltransferase
VTAGEGRLQGETTAGEVGLDPGLTARVGGGVEGGLEPVRRSFDTIAEVYAQKFADELERKTFDRELLAAFADRCRKDGWILDLGCGSAGHIGRGMADMGFRVTGVDFSERSIELARAANPGMTFEVADIRALPFEDGSVAAITAFYCMIYGTGDDVIHALAECRRVLEPGGRLLAAVHGGVGSEHADAFEGLPVDVTVRLTTPAAFATLAEAAGLVLDTVQAREPYDFEWATRRIYLEAHA